MGILYGIGISFIIIGMVLFAASPIGAVVCISLGVIWILLIAYRKKQNDDLQQLQREKLELQKKIITSNQSTKYPPDEYVIAFKNKISPLINNTPLWIDYAKSDMLTLLMSLKISDEEEIDDKIPFIVYKIFTTGVILPCMQQRAVDHYHHIGNNRYALLDFTILLYFKTRKLFFSTDLLNQLDLIFLITAPLYFYKHFSIPLEESKTILEYRLDKYDEIELSQDSREDKEKALLFYFEQFLAYSFHGKPLVSFTGDNKQRILIEGIDTIVELTIELQATFSSCYDILEEYIQEILKEKID